MSTAPTGSFFWRVAVFGWVVGAAVGIFALSDYSATQGMPARADSTWPDPPGIDFPEHGGCVLMFAHPRCPCTRASLAELDNLMRDLESKATVVFWQPPAGSSEWCDSDLIQFARRSTRLQVFLDEGGQVTSLFGGRTSGTCLVFDRTGTLRFNGGVTAGRGHRGKTAAHQQIAAILRKDDSSVGPSSQQSFPVFGCAIQPWKDDDAEEIRSAGS